MLTNDNCYKTPTKFENLLMMDLKFLIMNLDFLQTKPKCKPFSDFLINKKQTVVINRQVSTLTSVNAGTPQRPMLGPIIYAA